MKLWNKDEVVLIGYSFGADVLPFMVSRLPDDQYARVRLIALLSAGEKADFEFHVMDWIGSGNNSDSQPVLPELTKLKGKKVLCFAGEEETGSICKNLNEKLGKSIILPGAHHFNGEYENIALTIMKELHDRDSRRDPGDLNV